MKYTQLADWFGQDLDIHRRTLWMGSCSAGRGVESGVDYAMAERVIKSLHILDSKRKQRITIYMNNTGGDVYHGLAIYDAIKACVSEVWIIVFGHAFSMGSVILQAADKRLMMPTSTMMVHLGTQAALPIHVKDFQRLSKEGERVDKAVEDIYLERFKGTPSALLGLLAHDTYLSPEEAVEWGLADAVVRNPRKSIRSLK